MPLKLAIALVVVGAASEARGAEICGCSPPDIELCPPASQTLSLNARIFASLARVPPESVRLIDAEGVAVPIDILPTGGRAHQVWIKPRDLLRPATVYRLMADIAGDEQTLREYTTIKVAAPVGLDSRPPYFAGVNVRPGGMSVQCQVERGLVSAYLTAETAQDENGDRPTVQLDISDGTHHQTLFFCGSPYGPTYEATFGYAAQDPDNECYQDLRVTFGEKGVVYAAKATAWDAAGNSTVVDGLQTTFDVPTAPPPPGDGGVVFAPGAGPALPSTRTSSGACALVRTAKRSTGGAAPVVVGLLIAVARRRRRAGCAPAARF